MKKKRLRWRDGDKCWLCGETMFFNSDAAERNATLDHIIAKKDGGSDDLDNLRLAHRQCNELRHYEGATT